MASVTSRAGKIAIVAGGITATLVSLWSLRRLTRTLGDADALPASERQWIHPTLAPEVDDAVERAVAAGATGPLEFMGAGAEGIVFCDPSGDAYKVARRGTNLSEEAAWFKKAGQVSRIKQHVAKLRRYDAKHRVLVRECVRGKPGGWKDSRKINRLADDIAAAMRPYGWGAPERKENSYIMARGRGAVVVDAGFAHRYGGELVRDVLDVLNGRRKRDPYETNESIAYHVRAERGQTIPAPIADRLLARLAAG